MEARDTPLNPTTEIPEIIWYSVGVDGRPEGFAGPPEPRELISAPRRAELVHDARDLLVHQINHLQHLEAAAGPRLGGVPDRPERKGTREDVVVSLTLLPDQTAKIVADGRIFAEGLGPASVDPASCERHATMMSWSVLLRTGLWTTRTAALRLGPSPSGILTVIELVPSRARPIRTQAFVRNGLAAVAELCCRLRSSYPVAVSANG